MKLEARNLALALVLMVGVLAAVMASNSSSNLAVATQTCGISGCVSTPPLSSSTSYQYTGTSVSTSSTTSSTFSTSISSSTTTTTATTTSTFFSYTSTISTTITTTSYSTIYTATQTSSNTNVATVQLTTTTSSTFTNLVTQKGNVIPTTCPVSYVTNGNRLQSYAQFLRNFRDDKIQNTTAGRMFLTTFNAWYYSWAPTLTYSAATNPWVYRTVQIGVIPLLGILYASYFSYTFVAPYSTEVAALTAGIVASSLIGLAFVAPITYISARIIRRHRLLNLATRTVVPTALWLTASLITLAAAYTTHSGMALALGTVNLVLSTLSAGSLVGLGALTHVQVPLVNVANMQLLLKRFTRTFP